jgi:hypothetical protein
MDGLGSIIGGLGGGTGLTPPERSRDGLPGSGRGSDTSGPSPRRMACDAGQRYGGVHRP